MRLQTALAVQIVTVFTSVAVASRPGHDIDDLGTLNIDQMLTLVEKSPVAGGRHVVLRVGRQSGKLDLVVIVFISHVISPKKLRSRIPSVTTQARKGGVQSMREKNPATAKPYGTS